MTLRPIKNEEPPPDASAGGADALARARGELLRARGAINDILHALDSVGLPHQDQPMMVVLKTAASIANVTPRTMKGWCRQHGLGHRVGGRWYVNRQLLDEMIRGHIFPL